MQCCGLDMAYHEVFGIRVWTCFYRGHHARIYENLYTGQKISEDDLEQRLS